MVALNESYLDSATPEYQFDIDFLGCLQSISNQVVFHAIIKSSAEKSIMNEKIANQMGQVENVRSPRVFCHADSLDWRL